MDILVKTHRDQSQIDFDAIWKDGIFVFDSNVLLDLYRLPNSAKSDLIRILKNDGFNGRIWIGFQVLIEFMNNRFEAISDQKNKFTSVRKLIEECIIQHEELNQSLISDLGKLKLKQRHSLINPDGFINEKNTNSSIKFLEDFITELDKLERKQPDVSDNDPIKDEVLEIFVDKVGVGFDKKRLASIYKDGERRYEAKIPPGYKDSKKEGSHLHSDKEYVRKYGDLILWNEILEKCESDKVKHLVLVTGDVKEDWWLEKRGKKLGPRLELLNEIYSGCPDLQTFYMYDTSSFLKYAQKELDNKVKDSSIKEAKRLIDESTILRKELEAGFVDIGELLEKVATRFTGLKIGIGKSVKSLPLISTDRRLLYAIFSELFDNVLRHGKDGYVGIQAKNNQDNIELRFKNVIGEAFPSEFFEANRGKGIHRMEGFLGKTLLDYYCYIDKKRFVVELVISKNTFSGIFVAA